MLQYVWRLGEFYAWGVFACGKRKRSKRDLIGVSGRMFQQLGGCNAVIYYCPGRYSREIADELLNSPCHGAIWDFNLTRTMSFTGGSAGTTVYALRPLSLSCLSSALGA